MDVVLVALAPLVPVPFLQVHTSVVVVTVSSDASLLFLETSFLQLQSLATSSAVSSLSTTGALVTRTLALALPLGNGAFFAKRRPSATFFGGSTEHWVDRSL